jgi:hypothetical protein
VMLFARRKTHVRRARSMSMVCKPAHLHLNSA